MKKRIKNQIESNGDYFDKTDELARDNFINMDLCLDIRNCLRAMISATTFFDSYEGSGCGPNCADFRFYTQDGKWIKISVEELPGTFH